MKKASIAFTAVLTGIIISFCVIGCSQKKSEIPAAEMQTMGMPTQLNNETLTSQAAAKMEPVTQTPAAESRQIEQKISAASEALVQTAASSQKPSDEEIQTALKNAGYYTGSIDGKIGPKSKKAIENFQKENGLVADGKVGRKTWSKLQGHLSAPPEQKIGD